MMISYVTDEAGGLASVRHRLSASALTSKNSLLAADDRLSLSWRRDFIRSYLERDVPMFAPRMPAETIGRLWTMLAHQQGSILNQARLASALGVSNPTVDRYIDLLVDLQLLRRLHP